MGKILSTIAFCCAVALAREGACEFLQSGPSFGAVTGKVIVTQTSDSAPGLFIVFALNEAKKLHLATFDPKTVALGDIGSFFLSLNQQKVAESLTLFSGEETPIGGNAFIQLTPSTLIAILRAPQPLVAIFQDSSVLIFLGGTLLLNAEYPQLVDSMKKVVAAEQVYSFDKRGLMFDGQFVKRLGLVPRENTCAAAGAIFKRADADGIDEGSRDSSSLIQLLGNIFIDLATGIAYQATPEGSNSKGKEPATCSLALIPQ